MPDTIDIESILDKRKDGRRVQYLIKWENYDDSENTWENRADLIQDGHAKQIRQYEAAVRATAATTATATAPTKTKTKTKTTAKTTTKTGGAARRARSRSPAPRRRAARSTAAPRSARKKAAPADPGTPPPAPKAAPKRATPSSSPAPAPAPSPTSPAPASVSASRPPVRALGQLLLLCSVTLIGGAAEHIDVRGGLAATGLVPIVPPLWLMQPLALFAALLAVLTHPSLVHDPFAKWVTVGLVWRVAGEFVLGASGAALGEDLGLAAGSAEATEEAFVCAIFCFLVAHAAFAVANAPAKNDTRLALLACLAMLGADGIVALAPDHQRIDRQRLRYRALLGGLSAVAYCFLALTSPHA